MKEFIAHYAESGGRRIITGRSRLTVNAVATRRRIAAEADLSVYRNLGAEEYKRKMESLFYEKAVYLDPGPGISALPMTAEEDGELQARLAALGPHECLTDAGEALPDFRGVEYWRCENGEWRSARIEEAGAELPAGAVPAGELTDELRKIIAGQEEARRITNLTVEEREREKKGRLDAARARARALREEAEIAGEDFDAPAWYRQRKAETEAEYGAGEQASG
jgi:hypothetical protein